VETATAITSVRLNCEVVNQVRDPASAPTTAEIARRHGLSEPHVRRLLRFAYLAPDIVEAIVEGRQPRTLTVKLLLQTKMAFLLRSNELAQNLDRGCLLRADPAGDAATVGLRW
jgi:hypothetical protein